MCASDTPPPAWRAQVPREGMEFSSGGDAANGALESTERHDAAAESTEFSQLDVEADGSGDLRLQGQRCEIGIVLLSTPERGVEAKSRVILP